MSDSRENWVGFERLFASQEREEPWNWDEILILRYLYLALTLPLWKKYLPWSSRGLVRWATGKWQSMKHGTEVDTPLKGKEQAINHIR